MRPGSRAPCQGDRTCIWALTLGALASGGWSRPPTPAPLPGFPVLGEHGGPHAAGFRNRKLRSREENVHDQDHLRQGPSCLQFCPEQKRSPGATAGSRDWTDSPVPRLLGVAELVMQQPRVVSEQLRARPHGDILDGVCP